MNPPLRSLESETTSRDHAPTGADADVFRQRHPAAIEFARGVDVVEVLDTRAGELLELFRPDEADEV